MAFDGLAAKLQNVFKNLRGKGRLTDDDVKEAMREVRLALLEADVNYKIVKEFIKDVTEKAIGDEVLKSLTPGQHVVKIVHEELVALMGKTNYKLTFAQNPPTVYMMVGLQGAGKTTACGKIAAKLKKEGKKPLLIACDIYRPAAITQLQVVAKGYDVPVFEMGTANPVEIARKGVEYAKSNFYDVAIIDTAGRLHIDDELMTELSDMKQSTHPHEILLVLDALTGQDAVNAAEHFDSKIGVDGIILTKLDSDTRGGAALSVRKVTGKPIKFVGMGEKLDDLEAFYPDRMASRILGMGDVLSLIEKAQSAISEEEAREMEKKFRKSEFDLDDFLSSMQQMKKMGSLQSILGMIPGLGNMDMKDIDFDEKAIVHVEAIIHSMTPKERRNPDILNGSRKKRVALGSGRPVQEVNQLLKRFEEMKKMMKRFSGMGKKGKSNLPFFK